ncbi:phosphotransferase [Isosphaeraceae bacterium EP7]
MTPDQTHHPRLRSLPIWREPIAIDPLPGGITNRNELVVDASGRKFVARSGADLPLLGVDRRNEVACQAAASSLGIAPEIVHHEPGLLVTRYLDARTMTAESMQATDCLVRLAATLRKLHDAWDGLSGEMLYFSSFQTIRTYAENAKVLQASLPDDVDELVDDARSLARRIQPFTPVLCHNDLLPANILNDGERISLVDWEYAGIGHPLFDLAGVSANCRLDDDQEQTLLAHYLGDRELSIDLMSELRIFKVASLLREALWSCIQSATSSIDFDYQAYATENFDAYRRVRRQLDERADGVMSSLVAL